MGPDGEYKPEVADSSKPAAVRRRTIRVDKSLQELGLGRRGHSKGRNRFPGKVFGQNQWWYGWPGSAGWIYRLAHTALRAATAGFSVRLCIRSSGWFLH
jgi:hypothetical protein